uniref:Uncharacterized protein n=1 Tax=Rhizophora mucronata TaxID=61149 RepID=A0A2P2NW03_RHIMU
MNEYDFSWSGGPLHFFSVTGSFHIDKNMNGMAICCNE